MPREKNDMKRSPRGAAGWLALSLGLSACPGAIAGEWGVSPLRIDLTPTVKSAVVTVTGKTGPGQFLQVSAMRWTQDAEGRDKYEETGDLAFLPRSADLAKGKQLIRVGIEKPPTDVERAYRLFIRETPPPADPNRIRGAQVAVVVDFALPIFVRPAKLKPEAEIRDARVEKGVLSLTVANTGNTRVILESLTAGKAKFKDFRNWYLLAGATRRYTATLPREACNGPLTVQLKTAVLSVKREISVTPAMCG